MWDSQYNPTENTNCQTWLKQNLNHLSWIRSSFGLWLPCNVPAWLPVDMWESRQLILGNGSLSASFHLPLFILDESCVKYYHILDLLYVWFSAKNTKKYHTQTYGCKNRNKTKQNKSIWGGLVGCWVFLYEIHKFINLPFYIFKRWSFSALRFRECISKLLILHTFIKKSMCAHSNHRTGAVWHGLVNNRRAQFRQESSTAMFMNCNVFLQ